MKVIKDYTTEDKIYIYPGTNTLRNNFNIKNSEELKREEIYFVSLRLMELEKGPLKGNLDFSHFLAIHKYIFQDIYPFAGEIRKVEIDKGASKFCLPQYIQEEGERIFRNLKKENYFKEYSYEEFCKKLASFIGDVIALHPFREGNGRASRELFKLICLNAGYSLNYDKFTKEEILEADIEAFNCKNAKLIKLMKDGLLKKL